MDLEQYGQQVRRSGKGEALEKLARSREGEALLAKVDGGKLEQAAKAGDMKALSAMLRDILSTPEGKRFAQQVERTVNGGGR